MADGREGHWALVNDVAAAVRQIRGRGDLERLLRDKTRPSRIKPPGDEVAARIVALTLDDPPGETMHWTGA